MKKKNLFNTIRELHHVGLLGGYKFYYIYYKDKSILKCDNFKTFYNNIHKHLKNLVVDVYTGGEGLGFCIDCESYFL